MTPALRYFAAGSDGAVARAPASINASSAFRICVA
jgi:hypothetical protein